ncbi:MAG: tyrosine-type recombinase/integrase [Paracoccaceae bacterium]
MRKFIAENERAKREYLMFLREAKGQDEATLDKVSASVRAFEEAVGVKPFTAFHREWAATFKTHLGRRKSERTGLPLNPTTRDSTLRLVKGFVEWLSTQPGYRSRITYADAAYFNNNAREARIAHTSHPRPYPSLEQCAHAFRQMPEGTEVQRRDRAIFAFLILTAARDSAAASMRHKHVDLIEDVVHQDAREVRTKNGKSFDTWFFPVDPMYRTCVADWIEYLRQERLYGPTDAVFPKIDTGVRGGRFIAIGLSREPYANGQALNRVVQAAFVAANLPAFSAHGFRKTIGRLMEQVCTTMEERKAWSQNLGHDHLATTISAYLPVSGERQGELIKALGKKTGAVLPPQLSLKARLK